MLAKKKERGKLHKALLFTAKATKIPAELWMDPREKNLPLLI